MQERPPEGLLDEAAGSVADTDAVERRIRELVAEEERLLTPEQRKRLEEKAVLALKAELEPRVEVNGVMMTRREWKEYMEDCPHEKFSHPGVTLMDGSRMSICDRCKFIQHEAIAKMIEGEEH